MRVRPIKLIVALGILAAFTAGCSQPAENTPSTSTTAGTTTDTTPKTDSGTVPDAVPPKDTTTTAPETGTTAAAGDTAAPGATMPKAGDQVAVMDTSMGRIVLKFFPDKAPRHVKNFMDLAKKKFYDGTRFHRVMPGFMIQGGDPNTKQNDASTWGQGGPGYTIKGEMNDRHHTRGILSMARSNDPDSAGSQFFITVADVSSQLDPGANGAGYTVFGQVVQGMDVVDKIVAVPTDGEIARDPVPIKSLRIEKWPLKK